MSESSNSKSLTGEEIEIPIHNLQLRDLRDIVDRTTHEGEYWSGKSFVVVRNNEDGEKVLRVRRRARTPAPEGRS
ncbi:hypothetical protein SEA_MORKIE_48 [Gordonia phage Morkie]|jgi:hypothetical protein|nr:hypothetical protein SEA_MORKIE_48 [Gordonia phage Morkie]